MGYDSVLSDRALREIYLMPFMLAQKYAKPWSIMTSWVAPISDVPEAHLEISYNRVNGTHVSENPLIIQSILRDEWKFNGMVRKQLINLAFIDTNYRSAYEWLVRFHSSNFGTMANLIPTFHTRFGIYSIDLSINAGLDLEMPGTNKWRSLDLVNRSIGSRKLTLRTIKQRATKVLELVQKCAQGAPEVCLFFLLRSRNHPLTFYA